MANTGMLADGTATAHVSVSPRDPRDTAFASSALARKLAGGVGAPGYRVTLHTSNVCMAGTGAGVFFELIGEYGSSGACGGSCEGPGGGGRGRRLGVGGRGCAIGGMGADRGGKGCGVAEVGCGFTRMAGLAAVLCHA